MAPLQRAKRLLCLVLRDHGTGAPRAVTVGGQSPLGGRYLKCGRCGQVLVRYVNSMQGRLD